MIEKRRNFIINAVYFTIITVLAVGIVMFSLKYMMPFVIGFFVAFMMQPVIRKLTRRFREVRPVSLIVITLFYIVVALLVTLIGWVVVASFYKMAQHIPDYVTHTLIPLLREANARLELFLVRQDDSLIQFINPLAERAITMIGNFAQDGSMWALAIVKDLVTKIPSLLIALIISITSSYFFVVDYGNISKQTLKILPVQYRTLLLNVRSSFKITVGQFLKGYGILIVMTYVELSIALLILRVPYALGLAAFIAVVDILPVLGVGTILIPWAVFAFILGDIGMGVGLLVTYGIILVVRNVVEPKVIGHQIGLHPLLTLMSMYLGMRLFGLLGLFALPITFTIFMDLYRKGKLLDFGLGNKEQVEKIV